MNATTKADHLRQLLVVAKLLRQIAHEDVILETAATALEVRARRVAWGQNPQSRKYPLNIMC